MASFSWYTDWDSDGSKQYQTYMTRELPPLINAQYKANGQNAVGGLSSTGGTAVDYAVQAPGLYRVVGSYSGLFTPVDDPQQVSLTLAGGGASADAMWGPPGGPVWAAHDPSKNAAKLKGVAVYAGASGGGEGVVDRLPDKFRAEHHRGSSGASSRTAPGGSPMPPTPPGVPITCVLRPEGSHTWGLFESEMQESWNTTIGPALGV